METLLLTGSADLSARVCPDDGGALVGDAGEDGLTGGGFIAPDSRAGASTGTT